MKRILTVFFFIIIIYQTSFAQTSISGVINNYAKVTAIDTVCQVKLTVDDTTGFEIGTNAILIQIKGATIDESNTGSFGQITDMGGAGWYEKNEIDSVGENCIFLKFKLQHAYEVSGKVQLVTMPDFEDVIVSDTLTAAPWNGEKGGVLAFTVENELTQNANIDVSGKGFRGGTSTSLPNSCNWLIQNNDYFYDLNNWRGAEKGEGIAEFIPTKESGRGPQSTGGGGGNDHNSGGGGGSNFAPGGDGGINDEPSTFGCKGNFPGLGGSLITEDIDRIFFGGGGGAGHANNDVGTNGGNGGGIIILEAGSLTGNNYWIRANGEMPPDGGGDGAGGGGGGGTQVVELGQTNDLIHFEVKGGFGGLVDNNAANRCHGPGGGGSGGRLLINLGLGLWDVNYSGGAEGQTYNSLSCPDSNNGAEPGNDGNYLLFYEIVESDIGPDGSLSIDLQPQSQTVCVGEQASFNVNANGNPTSFQWQVDTGSGFQDITDGVDYSGTETNSLTILNPTILMSGWVFQCIISNGCVQLISDPANLEVTNSIIISVQPQPTMVCEGGDADFFITVLGSNIQYQWQVDDGGGFQNITDGATYSGTMTSTLTVLNPTLLMDGWSFQCLITSGCGNLVSQTAALEVIGGASVTTQPESTTACAGQSTEFSLFVVGANIQYQWQVDDGNGFQDITDGATYSGTMTSTLTVLNPSVMMSGWLFQCNIITDCGDLVSESAILEVLESASIADQPEPAVVCSGETALYVVVISGSNIQYQWQVNNGSGFQNISDGPIYSGTMSDSLTILDPVFVMDGWEFQCLITTDCGDLVSEIVPLEIITAPLASIFPSSISVCEDSSGSFKVWPLDPNNQYQFQWQVDEGAGFFDLSDNAIYSNTNSATLGISSADLSMDGFIYQCVVTYECGTVVSDFGVLTVESTPTAQFDFIVSGSTVDFNNLSSFNSTNYFWDFGDNSTSTEVDPSHEYAQSGIYSVQLIAVNNCGADTTFQEVEISFLEAPNATFTLNNGTGCAPLFVQFTDQSSGAIDTWNWTFPGGMPNTSTDQNPLVVYNNPGTFDVTLEVSNAAGSDVIAYTDFIFVDLPIFAGFDYSVNENEVSFTNTAQNATTFQWNFGDNSPESNEENPVHSYTFPGVYNVTLVATNPLCGSAITQAVDVLFTDDQKIIEHEGFKIFPNPVNDFLTVDFLGKSDSKSLKIYNSKGQTVFQKNYSESQMEIIDLSKFSSGLYILEVIMDDKTYFDKLIKH